LTIVIEFKFKLWCCERECTCVVSTLAKYSSDSQQTPERVREVGVVIFIVDHRLGLVIAKRRTRSDTGLAKSDV
jgi:hypothetical protein